MAIPNVSGHVTMSNVYQQRQFGWTSSGQSTRFEQEDKGHTARTNSVQLRYLYTQDIVQRGEMTISKMPTTDNPADALSKHLPAATITSHLERLRLQTTLTSTVGSLLGVPTVNRLTVGMINVVNNNSEQPTQAAEAGLDTPQRRKHRAIQQEQLREPQQEQLAIRQCNTVALASIPLTIRLTWSFLVSLLCTIILCLHYSYFGSTISPLATFSQFAGTMAGIDSTSHSATQWRHHSSRRGHIGKELSSDIRCIWDNNTTPNKRGSLGKQQYNGFFGNISGGH
eukprot:2628703-Amphidinium_carterae.4